MESNNILKLVYTFFVGLLLAIFVGVGVSTFYESPAEPEYPEYTYAYDKEPTEDQLEAEREWEIERRAFDEEKLQPYNRNVSIIVIISSVILLVVSIFSEKRIKFIADGIMLGGLFSLIYGIGRGFASQDSKYVFIIVTLSLIAVLYVGYHRFVLEHTQKSVKSVKK